MAVAAEKQIYFKPISILVGRMIPDYIADEYPQFVTWLEKYFEYMEQELGQYDVVANLLNYRDVDTTLAIFEDSFKDRFLHSFPEALAANVDLLVKNVRSFYKSRGTEDSFRFLFKALFNSEVEFFYPKQYILRTSDGLWYEPEFLVLTDQSGNIPPQFPNSDPFDQSILVDQFIFGVTTGTVALVDRVAVKLYDGGFAIHLEILEKEGNFEVEEQIVLGNNIVENGSFSDETLNWTLSPLADEGITANQLNELELKQISGEVQDKYVTQMITVEENTQYYLRYSLVSNKSALAESDPRFDTEDSRVTVGSSPGGNDLFDSGKIGSYVDVDLDSLAAVDVTMRWRPTAQKDENGNIITDAYSGIHNIYHINYDLTVDPGAYTPIGAGLTQKDTARISEFDLTPFNTQNFTGEKDVDTGLDQITVSKYFYAQLDSLSVEAPDLTLKNKEARVYWINHDITTDPATAQAKSADLIAAGNWQKRGTVRITDIDVESTPDRVYMTNVGNRLDFDIDANIGTGTNSWIMLSTEPEIDDTPTDNVYVWNSLVTDQYVTDDYVIEGNYVYRVVNNTTGQPSQNSGDGGDYVRLETAFVEGDLIPIEHDYHTGDRVRLSDNGNTAPTGLIDGTDYYVIVVDDTTIQLASTYANALAGTELPIGTTGSGEMTLTPPTRVHMSSIETPADFVDKTTIDPIDGNIMLVGLDHALTASNLYVWSASATYSLSDYVIKNNVLYRSTLEGNTTDPETVPLINWVVVPSLFVDGAVRLGPINTLKLLPATNSQQKNLYISIHNEMQIANQRSTFDGVSLVKKDDTSTPLLFIANQNGVPGIVTDPHTWKDTRGFLSSNMFLQDNDYYQEFSYEIQSTVPKTDFEKIIRDNVHPAGFKMFAKVNVGAVDDSSLMDQVIDLQMYYTLKTPAQYYASEKLAASFDAAADVDPVTDNITVTAHDFHGGEVVRLRTTGTVPTGLTNNMEYYVIRVVDNTIRLAETFADTLTGTQINITADGSGTINLNRDRITIAAVEFNYSIVDFFNAGQTFEEVEATREFEESQGGLLADLAQIVADVPIGYFDDRAKETFPWSGSYDVTITP